MSANPNQSPEQGNNKRNNTGESRHDQSADSNPQEGSAWNNYETKELSSNNEGISAEEAAKAFEDDDQR